MTNQTLQRNDLLHADDRTIGAWIAAQTGLSAVFVTAGWCPQSRELVPAVEDFAAQQAGALAVATVDFDESAEFIRAHNVEAVPAVLLFKDGQPVGDYTRCALCDPKLWTSGLVDLVQRVA